MIDGGVFLGFDRTLGAGMQPSALRRRLSECGISRALAISFQAIHHDFRAGNDATLAICQESDGCLLPMATVKSAAYDCTASYMRELKQAGFLGLALFPHLQYVSWSQASLRRTAEDAVAAGLILQAVVRDASELAAAEAALGDIDGPLLIRFMAGGGYNNVADILALGSRHEQLYFDVGTVTQSGGIPFLAERLGADRLYMATNAPLCYEAASTYLLAGASLSPRDCRMIESGTLAGLLDLAPTEDPPLREADASWRAFVERPKIDTHWHTGSWMLIEPRITPEQMSEEFDQYNYQKVISNSILALNHDLVSGNEQTAALIDHDPRVYGLVVISPREPELSLAEIEKYRDNPRFVGIKTIQDFYFMRLDDPGYAPMLAAISGTDWPIMAHLPGMAEAAARYPETGFVAAHSTWRYRELAALPNVWFDIATSTSFRHQTDIPALVELVGADRVIYSSDGQLMNAGWTLGKLRCCGLTEAQLEQIFMHTALLAFPRLAS